MSYLAEYDPEVYEIIEKERLRQVNGLELIASENVVSKGVLEAVGSILTNKYAEGYPGKRYYGGCEFHDMVENLARDRLCQLLVRNMQMFRQYPEVRQTRQFTLLSCSTMTK